MSNQSIALNAANDIFIGPDGNLAFVTGVDAVKQDCACALKAQLGEMIYNTTAGMPTFDDIWQSQNFVKWEAAAITTLNAIAGVTQVVSFTISVLADAFSYVAVIQTVYSRATISGTIGA